MQLLITRLQAGLRSKSRRSLLQALPHEPPPPLLPSRAASAATSFAAVQPTLAVLEAKLRHIPWHPFELVGIWEPTLDRIDREAQLLVRELERG